MHVQHSEALSAFPWSLLQVRTGHWPADAQCYHYTTVGGRAGTGTCQGVGWHASAIPAHGTLYGWRIHAVSPLFMAGSYGILLHSPTGERSRLH